MIADLASGRPRLAVAFDGPDAAGKTTLADRVARRLGQPVIRAGADGFHQPRQVRYQRGDRSAEGYYRDSFDYPAITGQCLARSRLICRAATSRRPTNSPLDYAKRP